MSITLQRPWRMIILFSFFLLGSTRKAIAFDTWWHAEATRKAMVANGFSADARLATQVSNYLTDFLAVLNMPNEELNNMGIQALRFRSNNSYDFLHFDAVFSIADLEKNWTGIFENTKNALKKYSAPGMTEPGFRLIVLYNIIGASLHAIQDFYSHSNWVNLYMQQGGATIPIWFDVPAEERKKLNLYTGIYAKPYNGHVPHETLNKDCSTRQYNKEAVEAAERASVDWVKRLIDAVPEAPWGELKAYSIQNDMVMKKFLTKLDATFLTSSSILGGHFDGSDPAKKVFNQNLASEKVMAYQALTATLGDYTTNMNIASNKYKLPTPYWSGFMGYNISYDIADGLLLNNVKYTRPR
ncbi:MAG TPA: hypothetical protein VMZ03_02510 [Chitinophagaceae bacterium]|nr:hypothetical protein [Chitinophagaceae bacterium]